MAHFKNSHGYAYLGAYVYWHFWNLPMPTIIQVPTFIRK